VPHYRAGLSERRIGEFLAGRPRDEFTVCTKVDRRLGARRRRRGRRGGVLRHAAEIATDVSYLSTHIPDALWAELNLARQG
jgi:aryl-alcohol dehydrogenase-like predicted oxidoreductase